jgi:hypothetical protein
MNSEYYEKLVDEYLALKLLQVVQAHLEGKNRESRATGGIFFVMKMMTKK